MRRALAPFVLALGACLAAGCSGGQTGEITELSACQEPGATVAIDAPSEAGPSAEEQLAELVTARDTAPLLWQEGRAATQASIALALLGEAGTLLDGPECVRPWLDVPVTISLTSEDGLLDETFSGTVLLAAQGTASARGALPLSALVGALELDEPSPDAELVVEVLADRDHLEGRLWLEVPGADQRALASF